MRMIIASNNENKVREIKEICKDLEYEILSLKQMGIFIDVVEDGQTIEENSLKKAKEIYKILKDNNEKNFLIISDDSGLMVNYLDGEPGVRSARFAGDNATSEENNDKLLKLLNGVKDENRSAKFLTVLTLIDSEGKINQFSGKVYGKILNEKRGKNGFGYDSIFYIEEIGKTFCELEQYEKNLISHRYKALLKLKEFLDLNCKV